MKSKSRGHRRRHVKSCRTTTTTSALPHLFTQDDDDDDDDDDEEDDDNVSVESNKHTMVSEETMGLGSLDIENCIRCNCDCKSGEVLVCTEVGCPIAIHERCMCSKPVFDKMGNFYCPYCAYKRVVVRTRKMRRKAVASKKVLSKFIDGGDGNGCGREDGRFRDQSVGVEEDQPEERDSEHRREIEDEGNGGGDVCCRGKGVTAGIGARRDNTTEGNGGDGGQVQNRSVGVEEDEPKERGNKHRREIEDEDNGGDNVVCRGEGTTAGIEAFQDNITKGKLDEPCVSEMHEFENVQDGERIDEAQAQQDEEIVVEDTDQVDAEPLNACYAQEKTDKDNAHDGLDHEDEDGIRVSEENEGKSEDEEQRQTEAMEVPANANVGPQSDDLDTGSPIKRKKRLKQKAQKTKQPQVAPLRTASPQSTRSSSRQTSAVKEDAKNQNEKATASSKESRQIQESARNLVFPTGKRKRLFWTDEELETIKEGVKIYSKTTGKKIPWRKILEFGHNVFHVTRTPVDLKDKWRKMVKEASTSHKS